MVFTNQFIQGILTDLAELIICIQYGSLYIGNSYNRMFIDGVLVKLQINNRLIENFGSVLQFNNDKREITKQQ